MKFLKKCPICTFSTPNDLKNYITIADRTYFKCPNCKSITLLEEFYLDLKSQKERYLLHNNSLEDEGYKSYLEKFLTTSIDFFNEFGNCATKDAFYLDFGSGPEPCLFNLVLLKGIFKKAFAYDLFFAPDLPDEKVDFITCLEVAEHFENPVESFCQISSLLKTGGIVSVQTQILRENIDFEKWWYRQDSTHVCFYTEEGLFQCAKKAGLSFLKRTGNTCCFRKDFS